jgi:hypothetical protein
MQTIPMQPAMERLLYGSRTDSNPRLAVVLAIRIVNAILL